MGRKAEELNITLRVHGKPSQEQMFKAYEILDRRGLWIYEDVPATPEPSDQSRDSRVKVSES